MDLPLHAGTALLRPGQRDRAAARLDLGARRLPPRVHRDLVGRRDLALAQKLHRTVSAVDEPLRFERVPVHLAALAEAGERPHVHRLEFHAADVREPALRKPALDRHLAAFEPARHHGARARTRSLSLVAASRGAAETRRRAQPAPLLGMRGAARRLQLTDLHDLGALFLLARDASRGDPKPPCARALFLLMAAAFFPPPVFFMPAGFRFTAFFTPAPGAPPSTGSVRTRYRTRWTMPRICGVSSWTTA